MFKSVGRLFASWSYKCVTLCNVFLTIIIIIIIIIVIIVFQLKESARMPELV